MPQVIAEPRIRMPFPYKGLDESLSFQDERPLTTPSCQNVRGYEPLTGRMRGGTRAGYSLFTPNQFNSGASIQDISSIAIQNTSDATSMKSTRTVKYLTVAGGKLYSFTSAGQTALNASFLSTTMPVVYSSECCGVLWWVDGTQYKYYNAAAGTTGTWTASAGSLPASGSERARLITTYRGRIVLAGLRTDPANYYMSRVGDPTDFDYAPSTETDLDATAGNTANASKAADAITGLISWSDDVLIFGCNSSIRIMRGDPLEGGEVDFVSDIGMAWGKAWCKDPYGTVYFYGSDGMTYSMTPGNSPRKMATQIQDRFAAIDLSTKMIRLLWDNAEHGFHLYASAFGSSAATTHYWYDAYNDAWFPDVFATNTMNPLAVANLDGDDPANRVAAIGTRNGYILKSNPDVKTDNGDTITAYVMIGPLQGKALDALLLKELQAVFGSDSDAAAFSLYAGNSAEVAYNSSAFQTGTWVPERNHSTLVRKEGAAFFVKLATNAAGSAWQLESLFAKISPLSDLRQRLLV